MHFATTSTRTTATTSNTSTTATIYSSWGLKCEMMTKLIAKNVDCKFFCLNKSVSFQCKFDQIYRISLFVFFLYKKSRINWINLRNYSIIPKQIEIMFMIIFHIFLSFTSMCKCVIFVRVLALVMHVNPFIGFCIRIE